MYKAFLSWIKSDNVIKTGKNEYREQVSQYSILFTRIELYAYFVREYYNDKYTKRFQKILINKFKR